MALTAKQRIKVRRELAQAAVKNLMELESSHPGWEPALVILQRLIQDAERELDRLRTARDALRWHEMFKNLEK